jgi:hypothetical protein
MASLSIIEKDISMQPDRLNSIVQASMTAFPGNQLAEILLTMAREDKEFRNWFIKTFDGINYSNSEVQLETISHSFHQEMHKEDNTSKK